MHELITQNLGATMAENYDTSWDQGGNEESFDNKFSEWEERSWEDWLQTNLKYPFQVKRLEDEDYFSDSVSKEPFSIGHEMRVVGIDMEDEHYGIILKVKEGRRVGFVPLCDVEVTFKENENYWPVREYAMWFANR